MGIHDSDFGEETNAIFYTYITQNWMLVYIFREEI